MENYYKTLGVPQKASQTEIKERFRFLANAYHPDKFVSTDHKANAEVEFKKISAAYHILSDPTKRGAYDRQMGLVRASGGSGQEGSPNSNPNVLYEYGQSIVKTVLMFAVFYIAANLFVRMGVGGLVLALILGGLIYTKYFWK